MCKLGKVGLTYVRASREASGGRGYPRRIGGRCRSSPGTHGPGHINNPLFNHVSGSMDIKQNNRTELIIGKNYCKKTFITCEL